MYNPPGERANQPWCSESAWWIAFGDGGVLPAHIHDALESIEFEHCCISLKVVGFYEKKVTFSLTGVRGLCRAFQPLSKSLAAAAGTNLLQCDAGGPAASSEQQFGATGDGTERDAVLRGGRGVAGSAAGATGEPRNGDGLLSAEDFYLQHGAGSGDYEQAD